MNDTALLALEDGTLFWGTSIGADGECVGEVVFNTSLTGYQEMLTDPSNYKQIVTLTYPHIGNVGVNSEDEESSRIRAQGLVVRESPRLMSNFRAQQSLPDYLKSQNVVAIADIDTRKLTRLLRENGTQKGVIIAGNKIDAEQALKKVREFSGLKGLDLVKDVTTDKTYQWTEGLWQLGQGHIDKAEKQPFHVVVYDYGVKRNMLRMLAEVGCRLTVVPAQTSAAEVLALKPDGVFLSNGPGDPAACDYAVAAIAEVLKTDVPVFGVCLGHQLLALASGATTYKMKLGHHGNNHPVQDLANSRVLITSQSQGFAVDESSLPATLKITHKSLFDGSVQGITRTDKAAFSFQGHPDSSPVPQGIRPFFDQFVDNIKKYKAANAS